ERFRYVVAARGLGLDDDGRGALPPELYDHVADLAVADLARGRPARCRDIAQTSDLGAQGIAHRLLELTAVPGRAGRLVLAGLQCGQRRSHLALETVLVGRQTLHDPLDLPLHAAERRAGVIEAE